MQFNQIKALLRKDFRAAKRNRKGMCCELLLPVLIALVIGVLVSAMSDYDSLSHPRMKQGNATTRYMWAGIVGDDPAMVLMGQYVNNSGGNAQSFDNIESAVTAYKNLTSFTIGFIIEATPGNLTIYSPAYDGFVNWFGADNLLWTWWDLLSYTVNLTWSPTKMGWFASQEKRNLLMITCSLVASSSVIAFVLNLKSTASHLVEEKVNRIRELLTVMGLSDASYLLSHVMSSQIRMVPTTIVMPLIFYSFDVVDGIMVIPYIVHCVLFTLSNTAFAFLMPTVFSKIVWSNWACSLYLIVLSQVCNFITAFPNDIQRLTCLLPPVAYFYASIHMLAAGETFDSPVTLGFAVFMLLLDTVILATSAWYFGHVFPGEFGARRDPSFIFTTLRRLLQNSGGGAPADVPFPADTTMIELQDLIKRYPGSDVPAVNGLDLSIRTGEIFALLGHNGAGKSTTMSVLIGLLGPTSYRSATVCGLDMKTRMPQIRSNLGMCPQYDVFFNDLTALEHFELFAEMRGLSPTEGQARIHALLAALELPEDTYTTPAATAIKYSGGMKRRLCAGNALVGNSRLVILDEPSSGLDPLSRRKLWEVIKAEKALGKTILLSTHFMEEADYLGDRIGIMSKGKMFCCGTAQELKEKFGTAFFVKIVKSETTACDVAALGALMASFVPEARVESESTGDITFALPPSKIHTFEGLFTELDGKLDTLGVRNYGVTMNTLEDVFVSISLHEGAKADAAEVKKEVWTAPLSDVTQPMIATTFEEDIVLAQSVPTHRKIASQINPLFLRRMYTFARNMTLWAYMVLVPIVLLVIPLVMVSNGNANDDGNNISPPPPPLTPAGYANAKFIYLDIANNVDSARFEDALVRMYPNVVGKGSVVTFVKVTSKADYNSGKFVKQTSVAVTDMKKEQLSGFEITAADFANQKFEVNFISGQNQPAMEAIILSSWMQMTLCEIQNCTVAPPLAPSMTLALKTLSRDGNVTAKAVDSSTKYPMLLLALMLVLCVVLSLSYSAVMVAEELKLRIYHNLRVFGMQPSAYWISCFMYDMLWAFLPLTVVLIAIPLKPIPQLQGGAPIFIFVVGYMLFAAHVSLQASCLAIRNDSLKQGTYLLIMELFTMVSMFLPFLTYMIFSGLVGPHIQATWISCTPASSFFFLLMTLNSQESGDYGMGFLLGVREDPSQGVGTTLIVMTIELMVPLAYIWAFSTDANVRFFTSKKVVKPPKSHADEDIDIKQERARLALCNTDKVSAIGSVKVYDSSSEAYKLAVCNVTLGVKSGECFGLLGPNGAGKTTFVKMLLGEVDASFGTVFHDGVAMGDVAVSKDELYATNRIGVCQQHEALWEYLTAREHMELYIKMRLTTVYRADHLEHVRASLARVELLDDAEKVVRGYSGGMKRKLSVALAMFTGAQTMFLDEPSTGMDPFARRALWRVIHEALDKDKAVVLTTHSMEEADHVCGRIGIITDGAMRCLGNSQHLKHRFGGGYVLTVTMSSLDPTHHEAIDATILATFPRSSLLEGLMNQRKYHLGRVSSLGGVFGFMERLKRDHPMHTYSVYQTSSLEQIFLRFVSGAVSRHQVMQQEQQIEHLKDELGDLVVAQEGMAALRQQLSAALDRVRQLEEENAAIRGRIAN